MQHVRQRKSFPRFDQRMNMIGHDAPGQKTITLSVKMKQCAFGQARNVRLVEPAGAVTGIEVFLNTAAKFNGTLAFGLKCQFGLPFLDDTGRHGISQTEVDGLHHAGMIPMRQVTARIPALMRPRRFYIGHHASGLFRRKRKTRNERRAVISLQTHGKTLAQ